MFKVISTMTVVMLVVSGIFYWYYNQSQDRIEKLRAENATLSLVAETNQNTIQELLRQQELNQQRLAELSNKLLEAEEYLQELRTILQRHDLTRLATERPGLIERRINDATRNVFNNIMSSTTSR